MACAVLFGEYGSIFQVGLVWGLGVTLAVYMTRYLSCAHLNPAVSVAMVLAGRIGASMCSELGTMAVTEQLDAYKVLGLSPYKFLLAPRLIATVIMIPVLTVLSIFIGIVGGYEVAHLYKEVSFSVFFYGVRMFYHNWDLVVNMGEKVCLADSSIHLYKD